MGVVHRTEGTKRRRADALNCPRTELVRWKAEPQKELGILRRIPKRVTIGVQFFDFETSSPPVNTILLSKNTPKN